MNPYLVLNVPMEANDEQIRQAYLDAIKSAPPDVNPEAFKLVSAAYERIKDEKKRNEFVLFDRTVPGAGPMDVFIRYAQLRRNIKPLPLEAMKELLRTCLKT